MGRTAVRIPFHILAIAILLTAPTACPVYRVGIEAEAQGTANSNGATDSGTTVSPSSATLFEGDTQQVSLTSVSRVTIASCTTNNASVAAVTDSGLITAKAAGSATITVTCSNAEVGYCTVSVQAKGLVVRYGFETVAGGAVSNLADSSNFPLSITSNVAQVAGKVGNYALQFPAGPGSSDCGIVTASGGLVPDESTGMTIAAWVKATSDWSDLLYFNSDSGTLAVNLPTCNYLTLSTTSYPGNTTNSSGCLNNMTWYQLITSTTYGTGGAVGIDGYAHVTFVVDFSAGTVTVYANGSEYIDYTAMSSYTNCIYTACTAGEVYLGRNIFADPSVIVDDLRIYNYAMTSDQVADLYSDAGGTVTSTSTTSSYSVTYSANGASIGSVPVDSTTYTATDAVTVLANTGGLAANFTGWNTASDGSGTTYVAGDTFTISTSTILYARYGTAVTFEQIPAGTELLSMGWVSTSCSQVTKISTCTYATALADNTSGNMLVVTPSNYNCAPKLDIKLPTGKTIGDYSRITVRYYFPYATCGAGSTGNNWFKMTSAYIADYSTGLSSAYLASTTTDGSGLASSTVHSDKDSEDRVGYADYYFPRNSETDGWITATYTIDTTYMTAAAIAANQIQLSLGISRPSSTIDPCYYIDDISFE